MTGKAVLVVFDGLGFSRERCAEVASAAFESLHDSVRSRLADITERRIRKSARDFDGRRVAVLAMYPVFAETLEAGTPTQEAKAQLRLLSSIAAELAPEDRSSIETAIRGAAKNLRYAPWAASSPALDALRNDNLTLPTFASGRWVGFEDLDPAVMGNSDTGHQQIGNLCVAPQTPLEISETVESGAFFENKALKEAVLKATAGRFLNFSFLLSGVGGADGRVHSAWNHLEAWCEMVFGRHKIPPSRVRMQAILDGRDSPGNSSVQAFGPALEYGDYLGRLEKLLRHHNAIESLAWVIGRNIAMDRDYREKSCRADYELLTRARGRVVVGFAGIRDAIEEIHAAGAVDTEIPPLVVIPGGDATSASDEKAVGRRISSGDVFVNLNFRADRQRARTAALINHRDFLREESAARGWPWVMDWLENGPNLTVYTLAEYHPALVAGGAKPAFPTLPQPGNFLTLIPEIHPALPYSLIGESNKAAHVGYFIRGRREFPPAAATEHRKVVPSTAETEGVLTDSDFHKTPGMRAEEIADLVVERMANGSDAMIACNFSNCDMIGHLLPDRWREAVDACEAVSVAVGRVASMAAAHGYAMVVTSDHGNIEENFPAHTANDILTTIIGASGVVHETPLEVFQARLFDVSSTLASLIGLDMRQLIIDKRLKCVSPNMRGRSLISDREKD